jgi:hypothetical protein
MVGSVYDSQKLRAGVSLYLTCLPYVESYPTKCSEYTIAMEPVSEPQLIKK